MASEIRREPTTEQRIARLDALTLECAEELRGLMRARGAGDHPVSAALIALGTLQRAVTRMVAAAPPAPPAPEPMGQAPAAQQAPTDYDLLRAEVLADPVAGAAARRRDAERAAEQALQAPPIDREALGRLARAMPEARPSVVESWAQVAEAVASAVKGEVQERPAAQQAPATPDPSQPSETHEVLWLLMDQIRPGEGPLSALRRLIAGAPPVGGWCRKCGKTAAKGTLRQGLCAACIPAEVQGLRETAAGVRSLDADDSEEIATGMERHADRLEAAQQAPAQGAPDWTKDSPEFLRLCGEVERLIRGEAHSLISGNAGATARLIMAQLAHVHGLAPLASPAAPPEAGS